MRVAVEGCCHGELDNIYSTIQEAQASDARPIDLLLICGDFQAIRNPSDLLSLAVPEKYRQLGGFHRYYSGETVAPILTIVIGGNHEASNYMWELFHGGWLAPNIYYLGAAGSVLVNGVRISGASGIYKSHDYRKGRFESLPYDRSTIRSTYHTREYDIGRLSQLPLVSAWPTIVLSHDWPLEIERYGDTAGLVRRKPFFKEEIDSNTLGSPPLRGLLEAVKPTYWFAAHLHVKFAALFKHNKEATTVKRQSRYSHASQAVQPNERNPDELLIDLGDDGPEASTSGTQMNGDKDSIDDFLAELERKETELKKAQATAANPDELDIVDDQDEDPIHPEHPQPGLTDTILTNGIDESVSTVEQKAGNPDEIAMDDSDEETTEEATPKATAVPELSAHQPNIVNAEAAATRFLALSKCLPGQDFLQILDIPTPASSPSPSPPKMTYDPAWLAITRAYQPLLSTSVHQRSLPTDATIAKATIEKELAWVRENVPHRGEVEIVEVQQLVQTAPYPGQPGGDERGPGPWYTNPQTEAFCAMLGLENKVNPVPAEMRQPKS